MDERTLWRFKTCAITITSPNQQGREGADSEEVWILTGKSVILLNRSSLNHGNGSLFPFKEAYFYACSLPARTSLRISWAARRISCIYGAFSCIFAKRGTRTAELVKKQDACLFDHTILWLFKTDR